MKEEIRSRVPWSTGPGLKTMTAEVGIDVDCFLDGLKKGKSDAEIAAELAVTEKLIAHLRDHFTRYGVGSIMGQD